MPYMPNQQRAQGARAYAALLDPHNGAPCDCDWENGHFTAAELMHRPVSPPDQSRYGTATDDPLGRDGPGWHKGTHGLPVRDKTSKERD